MRKKLLLAVGVFLLCGAVAFAGSGKDYGEGTALSACATCSYELSVDTVAWGNYSYNISLSDHVFTLTTEDKYVGNIEFTYFVPTTTARIYSQNVLFTDCDTLVMDSLPTDSGKWYYYQWVRSNNWDSITVATDMLEITLWTADCFGPSAGIPLEIKDNAAAGFKNVIVDSTAGNLTPTTTDGHVYFLDPLVDLTAWPPGASQDEVVDSAVAGGQVAVPLYLRDVTFEYRTLNLVVAYDTANLDFDHWTSNYSYSWNSYANEQSDGIHIGSTNK